MSCASALLADTFTGAPTGRLLRAFAALFPSDATPEGSVSRAGDIGID